MTDNEIIKALECSPLNDIGGCRKIDALDLINRQKAEIDRLQGYNENLITANTALSNEILDIKSETIKEFANRLKGYAVHPLCTPADYEVVPIGRIDNLLKEMAGE